MTTTSTFARSALAAAAIAAIGLVQSAAASDDVLIATATGQVFQVDPATGSMELRFVCVGQVTALIDAHTSLFVGTANGTVWQFELATGAIVGSFQLPAPVTALAHRDGTVIVGTSDNKVTLVDADTHQQLSSFQHTFQVDALTVSGEFLYIAGQDTIVIKKSLVTGQNSWVSACGGFVTSIASFGDTLLVGTTGGTVYRFNPTTGTYYANFGIGTDQSGVGVYESKGVATTSSGVVRTFDPLLGQVFSTTNTQAGDVSALLVIDDCKADFNDDGLVNVFDYISLMNAYAAGDLRADIDGNGLLNVFDPIAFGTHYAVGCN